MMMKLTMNMMMKLTMNMMKLTMNMMMKLTMNMMMKLTMKMMKLTMKMMKLTMKMMMKKYRVKCHQMTVLQNKNAKYKIFQTPHSKKIIRSHPLGSFWKLIRSHRETN